MTPQIPEVVPTRIDRCVYTIMGNTMPPRDPDDDEEDGDEEDNEGENRTDEPPLVREPDED